MWRGGWEGPRPDRSAGSPLMGPNAAAGAESGSAARAQPELPALSHVYVRECMLRWRSPRIARGRRGACYGAFLMGLSTGQGHGMTQHAVKNYMKFWNKYL